MKLSNLHDPSQLKDLSIPELNDLASQIRSFLIQSISQTGGHLSSNLGVVELTLAMHTVFDSPKDKLIFDVGHQSYVHKILTGRMDQFDTLRQYKGLSGFQKRCESEHDPWEAGHASTSISAALGYAAARDLLHEDYEVVALIGDGALGGGLALEALSDLGAQKRDVVIIFNDNEMSISANSSGIENGITKLRTSKIYRDTKRDVFNSLIQSEQGKTLLDSMKHFRDSVKSRVIDAPLFKNFDVDYIGPVDGHNMADLIAALQTAKENKGPIVVHVKTTKGKGYKPAQQDEIGKWHGVGPFDIQTGEFSGTPKPGTVSWSEAAARTIYRMAADDPRIVAITPAMATGSALIPFSKTYPDRFFDVGIAEEHAITMASAMAAGGLKPFVSIYSTFLQRAYDEILHDAARMGLPIVVGVDRAGLVGADGDTHQGIYDIAFLRTIPEVIIAQPKNGIELQHMMAQAFKAGKPFFIRYPRGRTAFAPVTRFEPMEIGSWQKFTVGKNPKQIVICYGPDVEAILSRAKKEGLELIVVNARFFKPVDSAMIRELFSMNLPVTVYETDRSEGSLASAILEELEKEKPQFDHLGIESGFVCQGSVEELRKEQKISLDDLFERLNTHAS